MNSESKLVVELWDYFRDLMSQGKRQDAATHLLRLFTEYGFEIDKSEIEGECEFLDEALASILDEDHEDSDYNDFDD